MKKLLYTLAFAVMGITAGYAQNATKTKLTPEQRAEKAASAMQQRLDLTEEQKSKIKQIELDRLEQQAEFRKQGAEAMKANVEERKTAYKAHQEKINAVLTAEQKQKLAAYREEMKNKSKDRKDKFQKGPKGEKPEESQQ